MSSCVHAAVKCLRSTLDAEDSDGSKAMGAFGRPSWPFFIVGGDFNALGTHPIHQLLSRGSVKASISEIRAGERKGVSYPPALLSLPSLRTMVPPGWLAAGGAWHGRLSDSQLDRPLSLTSAVSACFGHNPVFTHHVGDFHAALDWIYCGPDPSALGLAAGRTEESVGHPSESGSCSGSKSKRKRKKKMSEFRGNSGSGGSMLCRGGLLPAAALSEVPDLEVRRYKGLPSP